MPRVCSVHSNEFPPLLWPLGCPMRATDFCASGVATRAVPIFTGVCFIRVLTARGYEEPRRAAVVTGREYIIHGPIWGWMPALKICIPG